MDETEFNTWRIMLQQGMLPVQGPNNGKILKNMGNMSEMATSEAPARISDNRYKIAIDHITLLRAMQEIDNAEVKRLISLLHSPDHENWLVAEECIKQKLS